MTSDHSISIPVVVAGALGRMGSEVINAVNGSDDLTLVGAIDTTPGKEGIDIDARTGDSCIQSQQL